MLLKKCVIFILKITYLTVFVCGSKQNKNNYEEISTNISSFDDPSSFKIIPVILGGAVTEIEIYPYAVQFFNQGKLCGGVILNSWTVVTSAHCIIFNTNTDEMMILAGPKYVYDLNADIHKISSFVIHEEFNKEQPFACDIALLFLKTSLKLGKTIQKAVLVNHDKWMHYNEIKDFTVIGWGKSKREAIMSNINLKVAFLQYVSQANCSRLHDNLTLTADMFCLYGNGVDDTCQGDSGGGVFWNEMLVGLTSFGKGCALIDKPSIYTNMWVLKNWTYEHITDYVKKNCYENNTSNEKINELQ